MSIKRVRKIPTTGSPTSQALITGG